MLAVGLTGEAVFADDLPFGPGLLYGQIVRSPHPHAVIKNVDCGTALEIPGVKAVSEATVAVRSA